MKYNLIETMIKAVIVEDEDRSMLMLSSLLTEYCPEITLVGSASNPEDAYILIKKSTPDIVFLDIEMQKGTGFDVLERFDEINFEVIFTTAYEQYALKAIKFCAIDYLLKPIDFIELKAATDKVIRRKQKQTLNSNLEVLMQNYHSKNLHQQKIALSTQEGLLFVPVSDIIYCKSDGPYTIFHLKNNETLMTSKNLKEYEDLLAEHSFFRVHHSWLINLNEIRKYIRGEGGTLVMSNGDNVDVSKRKKEDFMKKISAR